MAKGLCILVHGFTGSPKELAPLADALYGEGYDVELPVLSGHCGSRSDLETATTSQWLHSVASVIEAGLEEGPVHLIGFSMGAMIAAVMAERYPLTTVTMLAPAVFHVGTKQLFRQIAGVIKQSWDHVPWGSTYVKERIERISATPLRSFKQFHRTVQLGKAALPNVVQPLCIIQGQQDEVVEPHGATHVYHNVSSPDKELHWLHQSGHLVCYSLEREDTNRILIDFLNRHPDSQNPFIHQARAK